MNNVIPIFYACDDIFAKFAIVSARSLIENADPDRSLRIHFLNAGISDAHRDELLKMQNNRISVCFPDVSDFLESIQDKLPIRDYYTKTTYYRLFISEMFPEYDKAVYLDSDTIVLGNIAELFDHDLQDNYVAASHEQAMVQEDVYGTYVEKVLGIHRNAFFNAGVLVINCREFRENQLLNKFVKLLGFYDFVVTQDEDYLNVLCKDRVSWLHPGWNTEVFGVLPCPEEEIRLIHYIMVSKPWHYSDCRLQEHFWHYADKTGVAEAIRAELAAYTDEQRAEDAASCERLLQTAKAETAREDNFLNRISRSATR
ncbi:MAG: glycosyltransferase family 8 protein [Firmicutes bacterium]|nr:glycosyltransferase family 8 protein [Bacillota bacterium]